ncbi:DgyrCDS5842 [Dimorphilus gyrociliatus]|uniref:DgyrCDS5842 n=1 Tax=Dimorphilus gyrociliatus TaxID=2664684 RepID=A0A7I8VQZ9_9ANNE|nr:DgyrCDS5842 [Dimorphilus gyrociliatus]
MSWVRTYNPSVRVGNWNEDIALEENTIKDFLERRERGELLIQKSSKFRETLLEPITTSTSRDGKVHFGDLVQLGCEEPKSVLSLNGNDVYGSRNVESSQRNVFCIVSCDGTANGEPLNYGQDFMLRTAHSCLFLESDRQTFARAAKKSRHNLVQLVERPSKLTRWRAIFFNPKFRLESTGFPVQANEKCLIQHCMTNVNLNLESEHLLSTPFGKEYEVAGHSCYDSHKAELGTNHWRFEMDIPGGPEKLSSS